MVHGSNGLRRAALAFGIALVTAFAAVADSTDGKGVVAVAYDGKTQAVFPVVIVEIDGRLQPQPPRDTYFLDPGKHSFRLAALLGDEANIQRGNTDKQGAKRVIEVDVAAGKRYLIGAKVVGRTGVDWEPVVFRVEDRGGKAPS